MTAFRGPDVATESKPEAILREDYTPPDHWIERTDLEFDLGEDGTTVRARLEIRRNEDRNPGDRPLQLLGEELETRSVKLDGRTLSGNEFSTTATTLTIPKVPERFVLETEVRIHPENNTALSGLYKSSGNFCTQCEAEGFRRITWYLDRPDVMSRYTTTITAERERYPVLLSNGNRSASEDLGDGRHRVKWEDPHKKPSYLFALVAGDLRCHSGTFTTRSGREVKLEIWVEPQNIDSCEHALVSLQKSMKWDEEVFGREYDLDVYMIVAVSDFNMGAMENKGLNIFNSKYVLARPETATDTDYEGIEGVIAHEYFHNWTGNRVTCRDWFQLTLKEGLTVFRDQQFSADMTSKAVKRIDEVRALRTAQFAEDAGPMAHPIRPESYIEMNNFYTSTVYNKGAEVIRMYNTFLGAEGFRKGMDLYFERHDGQAVTCDDFRAAMADANGFDFTQFERWYSQAGTPRLTVRGEWSEADETYTLHIAQSIPPTPGQVEKLPMHVPVRVGLVGPGGEDLPLSLEGGARDDSGTLTLSLTEAEHHFTFTGVRERPVPSVLRNFSAPVRVEFAQSRADRAFLMSHDSDSFNRWEAGQALAREILLELCADASAGRELVVPREFIDAFGAVLGDAELDGSLKALALSLPGEKVLGQEQDVVDVDGLHAARRHCMTALAQAHETVLVETYERFHDSGPYTTDRAAIDGRRLKNTALAYLALVPGRGHVARLQRQFSEASNMTDKAAALVLLCEVGGAERDAAVAEFYDRWKSDPLVLDKWFMVQAMSSAEGTLERVRELSRHADFTLKNPNRVRSLVGAFCMGNQVRFHAADGGGYAFLADVVLELDSLNPQVTSRLVSCFNAWRRFDAGRQGLMRAELERIARKEGLSKDVFEIVSKALAE